MSGQSRIRKWKDSPLTLSDRPIMEGRFEMSTYLKWSLFWTFFSRVDIESNFHYGNTIISSAVLDRIYSALYGANIPVTEQQK